jgi:lipopolysaccharide biosynthesis glycosyltransferase
MTPSNLPAKPKSMGDIHVVLAADANYAMPMSVVMASAAINCASDRSLSIHVIESGYADDLKERVTSSLNEVRPENLSVHWYPVISEELSDLPVVQSHINLMTYSRLLMPQLLPSTVHQALYLDCDVLVEGDISQLWDASPSEKALGAVRDRIGCVGNQGGLSNYQELNIGAETPYFNAGVLLFNLDKWRREAISQRVFNYLRKYNHILRFEDQEALNAVLHDDWSEIPARWNQQIVPRFFRAGSNVALPNLIEEGIIHFITGEKPWLAGCEYVERQRFYQYLDRTNWRGWRIKRREEVFVRSKRAMGDLWRSFRQQA